MTGYITPVKTEMPLSTAALFILMALVSLEINIVTVLAWSRRGVTRLLQCLYKYMYTSAIIEYYTYLPLV